MNKWDIFSTIYKLKTPLIKVAGIALKDRVDLISIIFPLEVVAKMIIAAKQPFIPVQWLRLA